MKYLFTGRNVKLNRAAQELLGLDLLPLNISSRCHISFVFKYQLHFMNTLPALGRGSRPGAQGCQPGPCDPVLPRASAPSQPHHHIQRPKDLASHTCWCQPSLLRMALDATSAELSKLCCELEMHQGKVSP